MIFLVADMRSFQQLTSMYIFSVHSSTWNTAKLCDIFAYMTKDTPSIVEKFKELRQRAGVTMDALASHLGYKGRSSIQRYEDASLYKKPEYPLSMVRKLVPLYVGKGEPKITIDEIMALAGARPAESPALEPVALQKLPVLGVVAAGVWLENDAEPEHFEPVPVTPDARYSVSAQFGVKVRGTSINKIAQDGDILICISADETALEPKEGDLVIVRRIRHQGALIETTAKRFHKNGHFELWPVSTDPKHQDPIIVPEDNGEHDEVIQIAAIVTGIYRPLTGF